MNEEEANFASTRRNFFERCIFRDRFGEVNRPDELDLGLAT